MTCSECKAGRLHKPCPCCETEPQEPEQWQPIVGYYDVICARTDKVKYYGSNIEVIKWARNLGYLVLGSVYEIEFRTFTTQRLDYIAVIIEEFDTDLDRSNAKNLKDLK